MLERPLKGRVGIDSLLIRPVSRSSAQQRAGRAGRDVRTKTLINDFVSDTFKQAPGICYRLYPESAFNQLVAETIPEIKRCSLAFALLHLLASGQDSVFTFDFMDRPDDEDSWFSLSLSLSVSLKLHAVRLALFHLFALGAVGQDSKVSELGKKMASFPLEPAAARIVVASFDLGCPAEAISLVSIMAYADTILINNANVREQASEAHQKFLHRDGDHMTLLNVLKAYEAVQGSAADRRAWCKDNFVNFKKMGELLEARKQLRERCMRLHLDCTPSCGDTSEPVLEACMAGLFANTALRQADGTYHKTVGRMVSQRHNLLPFQS